MDGYPTVDQVRAWCDIAPSELDDHQLGLILAAEIASQAQFCPPWQDSLRELDLLPEPLGMALLRRCARAAAARGVPLGTLPAQMTGTPHDYGVGIQWGVHFLPQLDAEIERLEAPWRVVPVA